jgi:hypothetical protein
MQFDGPNSTGRGDVTVIVEAVPESLGDTSEVRISNVLHLVGHNALPWIPRDGENFTLAPQNVPNGIGSVARVGSNDLVHDLSISWIWTCVKWSGD